MGWPVTRVWWHPKTWATNDSPAAHEFNTYVRDNQLALISTCRAVFNGTAGAYVPSATSPLIFGGVSRDPTNMWSAGAPTRITVPLPGVYACRARLGGSSTTATSLVITKNGGAIIAESPDTLGNVDTGKVHLGLAGGDYLEASAVTDTGGYAEAATLGCGALIADFLVAWVSPA